MSARRFRLGVDVGGTFTDFVLVDTATGALFREKCLTTPDDPVRGIMHGIDRLVAAGIVEPRNIGGVAHATTLITNTLIERKGARTGLLATAGFRDLIELGSDMRYDMYDLAIEFPEPLAPRPNRRDVRERVDAAGEVVVPLRAADVRREVKALLKQDVESIAVCFLHSYRNPVHERAVVAQIAEEFPDVPVSASSAVAPEVREYERTVTVVANAYVKPAARSYLSRVEKTLAQHGVKAPILVMLSNGGMTTPRVGAEVPIRLVESGPAAGVLSACHAGARIGERNLLAFDMGGTTAKACFIDHGKPAFTGMFEAARVRRQFRGSGMPLKIPSVEMIEIGAGGGSIARLDKTGLLKVGPDSAGAKPGPACYGLGGDNATVTDADLLLGYLDPGYFLGGDMTLDVLAARRAVAALGERCGLDVSDTAAGIAQVVNQNMATAVRIHAAERGKDYRRYALFAFGGAGPVHAYEVARILRLRKIICPPGAGTSSAFGLLAAPVAVDLSRSYNAPLAELDLRRLNAMYAEMEREARAMLKDAGVKAPQFVRTVDMRFVGQGFELPATVPGGKLDKEAIAAAEASFHDAYRAVYAELPGKLPAESITWRLRATGPDPELAVSFARSASPRSEVRSRRAYFPELKAYADTPVFDRYALKPGATVHGPAIIEERESTAIVGPSGHAAVDDDLNLVVHLGSGA
ncbi:MAG: hydantoinase/oxoprolinase family protein [Rhodospirillaceae bacterium]